MAAAMDTFDCSRIAKASYIVAYPVNQCYVYADLVLFHNIITLV